MKVRTVEMARHMAAYMRKRRLELGLTALDVAAHLETTPQYVGVLEHGGTKNPSLGTMLGLCEALQCSLNDLLGCDVSMSHEVSPFDRMMLASEARYAAMTPEQQAAMWQVQRESFVRDMAARCEHGWVDFEDCPDCRAAGAEEMQP